MLHVDVESFPFLVSDALLYVESRHTMYIAVPGKFQVCMMVTAEL